MGRALRPSAWRALAAATLLLGSGACLRTEPVAPEADTAVLVGVVVADSDSAFVSLGRTRGSEEQGPLPGARMVLTVGGGEEVVLEPRATPCGLLRRFTCYAGRLASPPAPGDGAVLEGTLPSGRTFRGEAVVPRRPDVSLEGAGPADTVRGGSWRDTRPGLLGAEDEPGRVALGDTLVEATVWAGGETMRCPVVLPGPDPQLDLRDDFLRISVSATAPRCPGDPAWDSAAVPIPIHHYDPNFTAWASAPFLGPGDGRDGVTGLHGVFGAATPRTFVLIVTP